MRSSADSLDRFLRREESRKDHARHLVHAAKVGASPCTDQDVRYGGDHVCLACGFVFAGSARAACEAGHAE